MRSKILFLLLPTFLFSVPYNPQNRKAWGPWGKDASLTKRKTAQTIEVHSNPAIAAAKGLIYLRQNVLTQADGPRSHYFPSSSQYALDAINKYGFFWGYLYACDRLMRENNDEWIYATTDVEPLHILKYDPVK